MMTWAWKGPGGKPVFNFKSDGRDFSKSDRLLILATGFYEYTAPANPKVKLKDQHFFTLAGHDWFWIAGIEKQGCFTMLTTNPGPDVKPYHDRQICVLEPKDGPAWLNLTVPEAQLLRPLPLGSLRVKTLRRDGVSA
jgi:putative SOS response-associated peptidase YedK